MSNVRPVPASSENLPKKILLKGLENLKLSLFKNIVGYYLPHAKYFSSEEISLTILHELSLDYPIELTLFNKFYA